MLEINEMWRLSKNYVLNALDSEKGPFFLFNLEDGTIFDLNLTSYFQLSLFDGKRTIEEIENLVVKKFASKNLNVVKKDFVYFIRDLIKEGILTKIKGGKR